MKKYRLSLILLGLLMFTLFSSLQINNALSSSTVNYPFNDTEIYNQANPSYNSTYNVRNQTITGDLYNGTYSFTDDANGSDPSGWIVNNEARGSIEVVSDKENHDKVLLVYDNSNSAGCDIEQVGGVSFNEIYGTIDYWFLTNDASYTNYFCLVGITDFRFQIYTLSDTFWYYDGSVHDTGVSCLDDTWYHIRVDFEHQAGGYLGLSPDTWNLWINGVKIGTYGFSIVGSTADRIALLTSTAHYDYRGYYDAFDYSWITPDSIGRNLFPNVSITNIQEVNKWEFMYEADGTPVDMGQSDIPYWETTSGTPYISPNYASDGASVCFIAVSTTHWTLEHEFSENYGIIEVGFNLFFTQFYTSGSATHYYNVNIYSADSTLINRLRFSGSNELDLSYYDGSSYVLLYDNFHSITPSSITFTMTMINSTVYLRSNQFSDIYIPKIDGTKEGLSKIEIDTYASSSDSYASNLYIDSIFVYVNGVSLTQDVATYNIDNIDWNLEFPTYIVVNGIGNFSLSFRGTYITFELIERTEFNGTLRKYLSYIATDNVSSGTLKITANETFTINSINIYQIHLSIGAVVYYPTLTMSGTNDTESYFYVDSNQRLRFNLIVNDNDPEWMELSFDIPNLPAENRSISFLSNINGNSFGFLRVNYTDDTSTFIPLPIWMTTSTYVLPQTKTIGYLTILITDNDKFNNDICSGFITTLKLIYNPALSVSIITLNLTMVMVPIIVLLVPTFGVSARYGKNTILPMFILMSIICFATDLIPVWLFFIIMISAGAFLFMKHKGAD